MSEAVIEPGQPMTPDALRNIADWLDTYDTLALTHFAVLEALKMATADELEGVRAAASGKEVQQDLRRWATEMESSSPV